MRYLTYDRPETASGKERRYKYKNCCCRIWNRWRYREFITGEFVWYHEQKSKERYVESEFDEALQEAFYKSSYRGDFWWVRSRRISTRKIYRSKTTELVIKNKGFIDNSLRCIKKFWGYANNGRNLKTFFISGSSGLEGKSRFAKDLARRYSLLTAKVSIQFILLNGKRWKDIWISLIQV